MSNPAQARRIVLLSIFLLAAIAIYRGRSTSSTFTALWATTVVGLVLSIMADLAPMIAGPFAGLIVLGSLTNGNANVIGTMMSKAGGSSSSTTTSHGSGTQTTTTGQQSHGPAGGAQ